MVYKTFLNSLKNHLLQRMDENTVISIRPIRKNNGLVLDGMCIGRTDSPVAPTIYPKQFYEQFLSGRPITDIEQEILGLYHAYENGPCLPFERLLDLDSIRHRLAFRIVNTQLNQEQLSDIPHIPYLDLAIIFYIYLDDTSCGNLTALVSNAQLKLWNITETELYRIAFDNTPTLLPPTIQTMEHVLFRLAETELGQDYSEELISQFAPKDPDAVPIYVLTNRLGIYGSSCILYKDQLKNFAAQLERDLVLLPSSVHEVLILPYEDCLSLKALSEMVSSINETEISPEDLLSDHIYFYSRSSDRLTIPIMPSAPHETVNP